MTTNAGSTVLAGAHNPSCPGSTPGPATTCDLCPRTPFRGLRLCRSCVEALFRWHR